MKQRLDRIINKITESNPLDLNSVLAEEVSEVSLYLTTQLQHLQDSLPIIHALQTHAEYCANELIPILNKSSRKALLAFAQVTHGHKLNTLVNAFLIQNTEELNAVNRKSLIEFLRQPDLSGELTRFIESFESMASTVMSVKFLLTVINSLPNINEHIEELRSLLIGYTFPINNNVLKVVVDLYKVELQKNPFSETSNSFILLIHQLLNRMNHSSQVEFINSLDINTISSIIGHCFKELPQKELYKELLYILLSAYDSFDQKLKDFIENRLNQQDSYLFESDSHQALATELLMEKKNVSWVEYLLTSPEFVAKASAKTIKALAERYQMVSFLSEEANLSRKDDHLTKQIESSFSHIDKMIQMHPESKDLLIAKRLELKQFASARTIFKLLSDLEKKCNSEAFHNTPIGHKTLKIIYLYFLNTLPGLRGDLFFQAVDYAYQNTNSDHRSLNTWFKQYAPDFVFEQSMLQRKDEVLLYNSEGDHIAFLNEQNAAVCFVNDFPILLIDTDTVKATETLFDKQNVPIGNLTQNGQVTSANPSQKNASAQLLAKVPEQELQKSNEGLALLIQNVLFENSLEEMLLSTTCDSKKIWLEHQFTKAIKSSTHTIEPATLHSIASQSSQYSDDSVFSLLRSISHKTNAIHLFHGILLNDTKREQLFSGMYESDFQKFLATHNVVECFAEYLIHYYDKEWFALGLKKFAFYATKNQMEQLFSDTLTLIASKIDLSSEQLDEILKSLINSEETAKIILNDFGKDKPKMAIQNNESLELTKIASHFSKRHLVGAFKKLNKTSFWESSALYKLVLYILNIQFEDHFSLKESWQPSELADLGYFISRHLSKKRPFDYQSILGYKILGELIFKSAQLGQVSMFYSNKKFNPNVAGLFLSRFFIENLIDKFWVPAEIKEQFEHDRARFIACFNEQLPIHRDLKSNQILSDWCLLVNQIWNGSSNGRLPAICTLIVNYAGNKKPLNILLSHYVHHFKNKADYLHPLSQLMQSFPNRDFSAVLFDFFENILIKNSQILDKTILSHMAHYYAVKISGKGSNFNEAELDLLIYFGQNKHYSLVQKGCELLSKDCNNKSLRKKLIKGASEAKVEGELSTKRDRFYFGLIKTLKRLFNYGFNAQKRSSKIVKFCDEDITQPSRTHAKKEITIPQHNEQNEVIHLDFDKRKKQFINLLAAIKGSITESKSMIKTSTSNPFRFHKDSEDPKGVTSKFGPASNKGVVTI